MGQEQAVQALKRAELLVTGHFVYSSGKHGHTYVNKDDLYPHTMEVSLLCRMIAERFIAERIEVVVAPEKGGITLSQWTAYHLSLLTRREVLAVYASKLPREGDLPSLLSFFFERRNGRHIPGRRVLCVDDVATTGRTLARVIQATEKAGGVIGGIGILVNRGGAAIQSAFATPKVFSVATISLPSWEAWECPLCARGVTINTALGHGKEFLERGQKT